MKTFLGAGYESSALTLTWAFLLLAEHPDVDASLCAELASLSSYPPTIEEMSNLPYTQAVVKETLRLYPPLWMTGRQSVNQCEIGGVTAPKGALVMTSQWAIHRSERYFPDPDSFRPERWLNGSKFEMSGKKVDKIEAPISYRTEPGYRSGAGFRVVYRFLGVADGKLTIACKAETKGPLQAGLQSLLAGAPGVMAETRTVVAMRDGAPMTVDAPLCVSIDLLQVGQQRTAPFKIRSLTGNRMLKFEITAADAKTITLKLVQPLAPWSLFHETAAEGRAALSVSQAPRGSDGTGAE